MAILTLKLSALTAWTTGIGEDSGFDIIKTGVNATETFLDQATTSVSPDNLLGFTMPWANDPVEDDVITVQYDGTGSFYKAGGDPIDDKLEAFGPTPLTNCSDPQSNVTMIDGWMGPKNCFEPVRAVFDGFSYLTRLAGPERSVNAATVSMWIKIDAFDTGDTKLFDIGDKSGVIANTSRLRLTNEVSATGASGVIATVSNYRDFPNQWDAMAQVGGADVAAVTLGTFHHIFYAFRNSAGGGAQLSLWINGALHAETFDLNPDKPMDILGTDSATGEVYHTVIGARHNEAQIFTGQMTELWSGEGFIDPAVDIGKFIDVNYTTALYPFGRPVDHGITGTVNGITPGTYLGGSGYTIADWQAGNNRGTTGPFTVVGSIGEG